MKPSVSEHTRKTFDIRKILKISANRKTDGTIPRTSSSSDFIDGTTTTTTKTHYLQN
jgi:hypothetical protein